MPPQAAGHANRLGPTYLWVSLGYLVLWYLLDHWARFFAITPEVSVWYPALGLDMALLVGFGLAYLPLLVLSNVLATLAFSEAPTLTNLLTPILGGNLVYAAAAYILLHRLRINPHLSNLSDVRWFLLFGCLLAPFVAGTFQTFGYTLGGVFQAQDWATNTLYFFSGDATGISLVSPVLLALLGWLKQPNGAQKLWRAVVQHWLAGWLWLDTLARLVAIGLGVWVAFGGSWSKELNYQYIAFAPLILMAVQKGYAGALLTVAITNVAAAWLLHDDIGNNSNTFAFQLSLMAVGYIGVLLGASARERMRLEQHLRHLALYDPLTGLLNRNGFIEQLQQLPNQQPLPLAVIAFDLHNLRELNTTRGPQFGDEVLQILGQRLQQFPKAGHPARLWGNDFAAVLKGNPNQVLQQAQELSQQLGQPLTVQNDQIQPQLSFGIALITPESNPSDWLRQAEMAHFRAKGLGAGQIVVFNHSLSIPDRVGLEQEFRKGLALGEFWLHYQPVIDLIANRIVALEALARWQHPQRGLIPPSEFVGFAEETGLIVPLSYTLLERACREVYTWRQLYQMPLKLNFNVSGRLLQERGLAQRMQQIATAAGLETQDIELEVTESILVDYDEATLDSLFALREAGFQLILDDFGTGYSSLLSLKRFPFAAVKVDRLFLLGIPDNPLDTQLLQTILEFCKRMHLQVVVEGVENSTQHQHLLSIGCRYVQGYWYSHPLPPQQIQKKLAAALP